MPHHNGVAKRKNRTILERAKTVYVESDCPPFLWNEVVNTIIYLTNRSPSRLDKKMSLKHIYIGKPFSLNHLNYYFLFNLCTHPKGTKKQIRTKIKTLHVNWI
jgi:hypothetical protein